MTDPPAGLPPERLAAWTVFATGGTYLEAADAAHRGTGTVGAWLADWRATYGDDLFRSPRTAAAAEQTGLARQAAAAAHTRADTVWADLRINEAHKLGSTAAAIRARALELLPDVGTRAGTDARQIKDLAVAVEKLIAAAERLEDRPTRRNVSLHGDMADTTTGGTARKAIVGLFNRARHPDG